MKSIILKVSFSFDHCEIPAGTRVSVPAELAHMLVSRGTAEMVQEQAVIQPQETRDVSRDTYMQHRKRR
jgi:hypothetical protein